MSTEPNRHFVDERLQRLEHALRERHPELVVLDTELRADGVLLADLACSSGAELLLVRELGSNADADSLAVLDILTWLKSHGRALLAHLTCDARDVELPPRLVLIAREYSPGFLARLEFLDAENLTLLLRRTLASKGGSTDHLVGDEREREFVIPRAPLASEPARASSPAAGTPAAPTDAFLETVPASLRPVAGDLIRRLCRVDQDLVVGGDASSLTWSFEEIPLCHLASDGEKLAASLHGTGIPSAIENADSVDIFLDWVIALHLERLRDEESPEEAAAEFEAFELTPAMGQQILTPEEIEAFRS